MIYTDIPEGKSAEILKNCYYLTDLVITNDRGNYVQGLALCHCGPKIEAGNNTCYVKFGLAAPSSDKSAAVNFGDLLKHCEEIASSHGLSNLVAGVNMGNLEAYRLMLTSGLKTEFQGIKMTRNDDPDYHINEVYAIDDWR